MIWNPEKKPRRLSVDFKKIGLNGRQKYHLWSFWDEKYFGEAVGKWQSPVLAPRDCLVLKITGTKPVPVLVGSTLHISCGAS